MHVCINIHKEINRVRMLITYPLDGKPRPPPLLPPRPRPRPDMCM